MRFPKSEPVVAALATDIVNGLTTYVDEFPSPPVAPQDLQEAIDSYKAAHKAAVETSAAAAQGTAAKDEAFDTLTDLMKANLRYAENITKFDGGKLNLLGWGGRSSRTSLEVPGAPRTLELLGMGQGWVLLDWKEPSNGGRVAAYRVQMRPRAEGSWRDVGVAVESEVILSDQERGTEVEYRVVAVNKAGESKPSGIVTVQL